MTETVLVPGEAAEWKEFEVADFDPQAEPGSDEDLLGTFLADRTAEEPFGVVLVADPIEKIPDDLVKRMAGSRIPTKVRRESRGNGKGEKKEKKHKKD